MDGVEQVRVKVEEMAVEDKKKDAPPLIDYIKGLYADLLWQETRTNVQTGGIVLTLINAAVKAILTEDVDHVCLSFYVNSKTHRGFERFDVDAAIDAMTEMGFNVTCYLGKLNVVDGTNGGWHYKRKAHFRVAW
jgi:hypothetical protein